MMKSDSVPASARLKPLTLRQGNWAGQGESDVVGREVLYLGHLRQHSVALKPQQRWGAMQTS